MVSLHVNFAGLKLENPIIAASAPPTETVEGIVKCAEAGVGAVITKSSANFDASKYLLGARRTYVDSAGMWAQGTFRHETLTIEEGVKLVKQATKAVNIPIIASVGSMNLDPEDCLASCLAMQDAGASMIQLDLFYVPQPKCAPDKVEELVTLLNYLSDKLSIPVAPKLNHDIPAHYAVEILRRTTIGAVLLLDSFRVPVPIDITNQGHPRMKHLYGAPECSLFGSWQKPVTLEYTSVFHHYLGLPICAGGGFSNGVDAIEAIMLGATTVQFASIIIKYGYSQIRKIAKQMTIFLEQNGFESIEQLRGMAHRHISWDGNETYLPARAVVDHDLCIDCGRCTHVVFCEDIHLDNLGKVQIEETCDGCGLCPTVCPVAGALVVRQL